MKKCISLFTLAFLLGCGGDVQTERFAIPGSNLVAKIEKTHAHPFLAEYNFRLVLEDSGNQIDSADMTGDSGGLSRIDVLKVDSRTLAFRDHARALCVDIQLRKIRDCEYGVGGSKIGYFDFDKSKHWRFTTDGEEG